MYRLPDELRKELAKPLAPVLDTHGSLSLAREAKMLVSVGDVVTRTFLENRVVPHVMLVDGVTKRTHAETLPHLGALVKRVEVDNPPATITDALWAAIEDALGSARPTLIHVRGEEDLAVLPALALAPQGALVCYGQPPSRSSGEEPGAQAPDLGLAERGGVVAVPITEASRQRALDLLEQMKVPPAGRKPAGTTEGT